MVFLLSSSRIVASNITRNRPLVFCRYISRFKFSTSSSSSSPEFLCCPDEESNDFLPWLEQKAGREISSMLSIGKSPYGRSLLAKKSVHPGDCLLTIPYNVQIAPDNLIPEISSLLPGEVGDVARLAVVILAEQRKGQHSKWAPYVSRLPGVEEMNNTIFWTKSELEMIQWSSLYQETIEKNNQIKTDFLAVKPVLDRFSETFVGVTFESFQHAYALGTVEHFSGISGMAKDKGHIFDFVNHDGLSETVVLSDEDKQLSEVIADCIYVPGDQVLISYGKFSNATLMLDFGFTLSHNIYDEVKIKASIPHSDPLCVEKSNLLHRLRTPATKEGNSCCSSLDTFTIKEVRSIKGKGRGIPQALRAYCRVLCSTSSQELMDMAKEAADNDGRLARYPLIESKEIEAHKLLLSWFAQLIEEHNESIECLESSRSICMIEQHKRRRKMALDLLNGELRVLESAAEWLKCYCTKLAKC